MGNEVSNCCGPTKDFGVVGHHSHHHAEQDKAYGVPLQSVQPHELVAHFHRAAEVGDVKRLVAIMRQKKVHLDEKDQSGNTALHKAAWHGHLTICRVLVKYGANARAGNRNGKTPLHFAVQRGQRECAQYLEDIVHLPDPAEVKRKFRAKVKTSNCAKVFGPRRSIRGTAMLIPGVPESQCDDEAEPSPISDAACWGVHNAETAAASNQAPRPALSLELPAKQAPPEVADDSYHSGKSTARAESSKGAQQLARGFPSPKVHAQDTWQVEPAASRPRYTQAAETPKSRFAASPSRVTGVSAELTFAKQQIAPRFGGGKPADIWGMERPEYLSPQRPGYNTGNNTNNKPAMAQRALAYGNGGQLPQAARVAYV